MRAGEPFIGAPETAFLRRLLRYAEKIFRLTPLLLGVGDRRSSCARIPTIAGLKAILVLFLCRLRSLNSLEEHGSLRSWLRYLGTALPSVDEVAWMSERLDLDDLRDVLAGVYHRLMRNKVLLPFHGWRVAAIDGHEVNASFHRCCPDCMIRTVETKKGPRIQFYHRLVALQILGPRFRLLLDVELQQNGEDELAAARRLLERGISRFPRAFDLLTGDALYACAPIFKLLLHREKHALMVLKDDRRDLLQDARALFASLPPRIEVHGATTSEQWDLDGFTSWPSLNLPVRVLRSRETTLSRQRQGPVWRQTESLHDWIWVSTIPSATLGTHRAVALGHARWQIEEYGFNELVNHWHANHYFHHHPVSITAFWLLLFIAHALFHTFCLGNLRPAARSGHTLLFWARQLAANFIYDDWSFDTS